MLNQKQLEDREIQKNRINDVYYGILLLLREKRGENPDLTGSEIDCALLRVLNLFAKGRVLLEINIDGPIENNE